MIILLSCAGYDKGMVMTAVMETASERVTILMTPTEKSALETKAR